MDELGYVPFSKAGAELLFDVVSRAYERTSLVVTTNLPFEQWTEVLGSERLTGRHPGPPDPPGSHPGSQRPKLRLGSKILTHSNVRTRPPGARAKARSSPPARFISLRGIQA